jgi:hypothetical protein
MDQPKTIFPYAPWIPLVNLAIGIYSFVLFFVVILFAPVIEGKYILSLIFASVWTVYFLAKAFMVRRLGYVTFDGDSVFVNIDGFKNQKISEIRKVQKSGNHRYYLTTRSAVLTVKTKNVAKSDRPLLASRIESLVREGLSDQPSDTRKPKTDN